MVSLHLVTVSLKWTIAVEKKKNKADPPHPAVSHRLEISTEASRWRHSSNIRKALSSVWVALCAWSLMECSSRSGAAT